MTPEPIDYTQYSLEELYDCRRVIDAEAYPERAAQLDLLIKDRSQRLGDQALESLDEAPEDDDDPTGIARPLAELLSVAFALSFYFAKPELFPEPTPSTKWVFGTFVFVVVAHALWRLVDAVLSSSRMGGD